MQIAEGATVYTAAGQDLGKVSQVVIDPSTNKVTHLVVRKGWLFTEDKVVPVGTINASTGDELLLRSDVKEFDDFSPVEETHYVSRDEMADSGTAANSGRGTVKVRWVLP